MGVLNGKDIFSSKYVTAEITDSEDRIHYVPIKHTIGDYFITEIDDKIYAFSLKGARHLIYRQTLTKSFRVIQYDTTHFMSIKPEAKELELMLKENGLPKMNRMQHQIFSQLAKRERKNFEEHDLEKLIETFNDAREENREIIAQIVTYLEELDVKKIVTPVKRVTDFITEDLIATSPSFLGELLPRYQRVDNEHRKFTNTPIKGTGSFMKIMVIMLLVGVIGAGGFIAYDQGMFDGVLGFTDSFSTIGEGLGGIPSPTAGFQTPASSDYSDAALQAKYPEPEALVAAINSGEVDYNKMSDTMKTYVDNLEQ